MNLPVLIFVGITALLFIIFLVVRNQKDKKEVIDQMTQDYPKSKDEEGDADVDNRSQMHWTLMVRFLIVETIPPLSLLSNWFLL